MTSVQTRKIVLIAANLIKTIEYEQKNLFFFMGNEQIS